MSVLDTNFDSNFDSARELPSRASWLDNASANLLNDNSYFSGASRRDTPAWLGNVDFFDSSMTASVASEAETATTPAPAPESRPVHASESEPAPPPEPEGPPPPGVAYVGDPGPGPDGRNADGTYGAGHHQYTPPTYYPDNVGSGMTEPSRPALAVEEPTAPVSTPRPASAEIQQLLSALVKRMGKPANAVPKEGVLGEGPQIATADPSYVPGIEQPGGARRSRLG